MRALARTAVVAAGAGAVVLGSSAAAFAANGVAVTAEGMVKPNARIAVTAACPAGNGPGIPTATVWTDFGATGELSPMADRPYMAGTVTVPNVVPPSPDGQNTILVTCSGGETGSTTLPVAGNG